MFRKTLTTTAIMLGVWLVSVGIALAQLAPGPEAAPIARVVTVEGTVTATRADGTQVVLATDTPVFQGDVVETGSGAAIGLVFNDDTTFSLGDNARMVLDELIYNPDTGIGVRTPMAATVELHDADGS